MNLYKPANRYVNEDENGNLSITENVDLQEVLSKLHYYELVEASGKTNDIHWMLWGKYYISCRSYEEFQRYVYAYDLPLEKLLKKYPGVTKRSFNTLKKDGIETVKDLINTTHSWNWSIVEKIPGIGKQQYHIIIMALRQLKYWTNHGYDINGNADFFNEEETNERNNL